jgi:hypothetical protein
MSYVPEPIHQYTALELVWIFVSPLIVLWDVGYVLLRPISMPGGPIHRPFWTAYGLYGRVDHLYGFPGLDRGDGLVAAYAVMNFLESCSYLWCAWRLFHDGKINQRRNGAWLQERYVNGRMASKVLLVTFATSLVVCAKTILYGKHIYTITLGANHLSSQRDIFKFQKRWSQRLADLSVYLDLAEVGHAIII